jgi:murein DD-endopeptidase MepM/ murein hydrolase activator NlpD
MATAQQQLYSAIARFGPTVAHIARQYGISGEALLAKVLQGESGSWADPAAGGGKVSPAGAKAWGQFMPESRRTAIQKYGVDPWKSITDAVHGTALHLRGLINGSTGLAGYNPGDPNYPSYILAQHVGDVHKAIGSAGVASSGQGGAARPQAQASSVMGSSLPPAQSLSGALALKTAPQIPMGAPIAPPSFAAAPTLPAAYPGAPQSGGLAPPQPVALPDPIAQVGLPDVPSAVDAPGGSQGVVVHHDAGGYPAARRGKIIGVPFQGTHTLGNWQSDRAVDVALPMGTPILSVGDGQVVKVGGSWKGGNDRFDGYQVTIRLADGREVFYTHLRSKRVKAGQKVRAGQTLGGSGAANGVEHLHFATSEGDPRDLIGAR